MPKPGEHMIIPSAVYTQLAKEFGILESTPRPGKLAKALTEYWLERLNDRSSYLRTLYEKSKYYASDNVFQGFEPYEVSRWFGRSKQAHGADSFVRELICQKAYGKTWDEVIEFLNLKKEQNSGELQHQGKYHLDVLKNLAEEEVPPTYVRDPLPPTLNYSEYLQRTAKRFSTIPIPLTPGQSFPIDSIQVLNVRKFSEVAQPDNHQAKAVSKGWNWDNENNEEAIKEGSSLYEVVQETKYTLLVSEAGAGKTTAVTQLSYTLAKSFTKEEETTIPIYLEPHQMINGIARSIDTQLPLYTKQNLLKNLNQYNLLIILDGFDEVESSQRSQLLGEVSQIIHRYTTVKFLITSRPVVKLQQLKDLGFAKYSLIPLQSKQIEEIIASTVESSFVEKTLSILETHFKKEYTNPLLLILLVFELKSHQATATNSVIQITSELHKGVLFQKVLRSKLWTYHNEYKLKKPVPISENVKHTILSELAIAMLTSHTSNSIPLATAESITAKKITDLVLVHDMLEELIHFGILKKHEDHISFWHQSFQDFYYAQNISANIHSKKDVLLLLNSVSASSYIHYYNDIYDYLVISDLPIWVLKALKSGSKAPRLIKLSTLTPALIITSAFLRSNPDSLQVSSLFYKALLNIAKENNGRYTPIHKRYWASYFNYGINPQTLYRIAIQSQHAVATDFLLEILRMNSTTEKFGSSMEAALVIKNALPKTSPDFNLLYTILIRHHSSHVRQWLLFILSHYYPVKGPKTLLKDLISAYQKGETWSNYLHWFNLATRSAYVGKLKSQSIISRSSLAKEYKIDLTKIYLHTENHNLQSELINIIIGSENATSYFRDSMIKIVNDPNELIRYKLSAINGLRYSDKPEVVKTLIGLFTPNCTEQEWERLVNITLTLSDLSKEIEDSLFQHLFSLLRRDIAQSKKLDIYEYTPNNGITQI